MTDGREGPPGALVRVAHPWIDPDLARLYDAFPFGDDIPLYLQLASAEGGGVLELACGSGRVLLPLAQAGHAVVGVDASPPMLALAAEKLARAGLNGRCRLVRADVARLDLDGQRFDLAVMAVRSFAHVTTRAGQQDALAGAAAHLRPGGLLALDLLNPSPGWLAEAPGSLRHDLLEEQPDGTVVVRTEAVVGTDLAAQIREIRSIYEVIDPQGGVVTKRIVEWPFRWVHRFEAELLLERADFDVEAVHGGYHGEPFTSESRVMLFLARRRS